MGQGKNGQWIKGAFVVETEEQFPKKVYRGVKTWIKSFRSLKKMIGFKLNQENIMNVGTQI